MACAFLGIWFEINVVETVRELQLTIVTALRRKPEGRSRAMGPKATRKSSKQLKKSKKIQPVKSLRLAVRKAGGDQPIEY
jgi:hypothetical protein